MGVFFVPDFPLLTLALQVNGGGVVNPIISLTKVTYFFKSVLLQANFLGDIIENSISC